MNLNPDPMLYTKIMEHKLKYETSTSKTFRRTNTGKESLGSWAKQTFLALIPKALLDVIKMENFCFVTDPVKRMKICAKGQERIFVKRLSHKGLASRMYKDPSKLNSKKPRGD